MRDCETCTHMDLPPFSATCVECGIAMKNYQRKPITNADRIRRMSDEELAECLDNVCKSSYDEGYTKETDEPLMSPYPSTASEWITWLKEEAVSNG